MARRLLPNAPVVDYNELVTASIASEGLVNGIWFSCVSESFPTYISQAYPAELCLMARILNQRFPTDAAACSISPEVRTGTGEYIDLFITRNTFTPFVAHPTIIYEGKGDGSTTWDRILSQLQGYAEIYVTRNGQFIYMIGAMGRGCRFFRYRKGDAIATTCMAYNAATHAVTYLDSGRATTYDISTDQTAISYLIDQI